MSINHDALDTAVRRFPYRLRMLRLARQRTPLLVPIDLHMQNHWPSYLEDIRDEYHRIIKTEFR